MQSPVTRVHFRGQRVHVKRDDVFHLAGNKMRKLHWFVAQDDAFFKGASGNSHHTLAISNAMVAIAQLAHAKRVPFTYFSRGLQLRGTNAAAAAAVTNSSSSIGSPALDDTKQARAAPKPQGNLALALELGMHHVELSSELYHTLAQTKDLAAIAAELADNGPQQLGSRPERAVYIPQGAAFEQAQQGLALLAHEINAYIADERLRDPSKRFSVVVPCGTGTTALYMAQHLDPALAALYAVPCVGDTAYLEQQFAELTATDASLRALQRDAALRRPHVLAPKQKSRFGRLWWPLFEIHHELLSATGIAFDLVYGSFAWHTMFDAATLPTLLRGDGARSPSASGQTMGRESSRSESEGARHPDSREILYVHTGGVSGNASMLARYLAKRERR